LDLRSEVYVVKTHQYIIRYAIAASLLVILIIACFLFIRWLYWDNSPVEEAVAVFGDYSTDTGQIHKYSGNIYINLINTTIPAAKISYEGKYGEKLPGMVASLYSKAFTDMNFDIRDPKTYFSFVFTAFSQYDNPGGQTGNQDTGDHPTITDFSQAPEGQIYFSDWEEEFPADPAAGETATPPPSGESSGSTVTDTNLPDPERVAIKAKKPSVLILHTHSTESYSPYGANNYHSAKEKESVVQVGNIMTNVLESKYKYNVIHDKTKHDVPTYTKSYVNSQKTIISQLDKNPSVQVVMDVHRDALDVRGDTAIANVKKDYTVTVDGKKAARIMLVIGEGNPNYAQLRKFAVYAQKKMEKLYPGLFYKIVTKPKNKYNQYYRDHTLLVEVGCTFNTTEEAQYSAELFGNVMGEVLKELAE
jgi:stage II sporulation protein P